MESRKVKGLAMQDDTLDAVRRGHNVYHVGQRNIAPAQGWGVGINKHPLFSCSPLCVVAGLACLFVRQKFFSFLLK